MGVKQKERTFRHELESGACIRQTELCSGRIEGARATVKVIGAARNGPEGTEGWSVTETARRSGIPTAMQWKVENGQASMTYDKLVALAEGPKVGIGELFASDSAKARTGGRRVVNRGTDAGQSGLCFPARCDGAGCNRWSARPASTTLTRQSCDDHRVAPTRQKDEGGFGCNAPHQLSPSRLRCLSKHEASQGVVTMINRWFRLANCRICGPSATSVNRLGKIFE